jgi:hypothetical protein
MREDVHPRGVEPAEKRLVGPALLSSFLFIDESSYFRFLGGADRTVLLAMIQYRLDRQKDLDRAL